MNKLMTTLVGATAVLSLVAFAQGSAHAQRGNGGGGFGGGFGGQRGGGKKHGGKGPKTMVRARPNETHLTNQLEAQGERFIDTLLARIGASRRARQIISARRTTGTPWSAP